MGDHRISRIFWEYASRLTDADLIKLLRLGGSTDSELQRYVRKLKSHTTSADVVKCDALRNWAQYTGIITAQEMDELLQVLETLVHSDYDFTHNNWTRAENMLEQITPALLNSHIAARNIYKIIEEESTKDGWMMLVKEKLLLNRSSKVLEIQRYYESVGDVEINYQFILQWKLNNPKGDVRAIGGLLLEFTREMRGRVEGAAQRRNNAHQHGSAASSFEVMPQSSLEQGNNDRITHPVSDENDITEAGAQASSERVAAVVDPPDQPTEQFSSESASTSDSYYSAQGDINLTSRQPVEKMMQFVSLNDVDAAGALIDVAGSSQRGSGDGVETEPSNGNGGAVLTNEMIDRSSVPYSSMLYASGYPENVTHDGNLAAGFNSSTRDVGSDGHEHTQTELHVMQLSNEIKPMQDKAFSSTQSNRKK